MDCNLYIFLTYQYLSTNYLQNIKYNLKFSTLYKTESEMEQTTINKATMEGQRLHAYLCSLPP